MLIAFATSFSAKAEETLYNFNIVAPASDMAYVSYYYYDSGYHSVEQQLQEGENSFSAPAYTYVYIYANDGYVVSGLTCNDTSIGYSNGLNYYFMVSSDYADQNIIANIGLLDDIRSATCYVKADNLDKIRIQRSGTYTNVTLPEADTFCPVKFMPDSESTFTVGTKDYNTKLYKIVHNNEEVAVTGYNSITVADGDYLEVYANYPDIDYNVTFAYENEGEKFFTKVTVDGEEVENFKDGFSAKAGSQIVLTGDVTNYQFNSMTVNNTAVTYFYSTYTFVIAADTQITIDATAYPKYNVTFNVDDPSRVEVIVNYDYDNPLPLVAGENTLEVSSKNNAMLIQPADLCYLTSVLVDGTENLSASSSYVYVYAQDGMNITVTSAAMDISDQFCFYIDDKSVSTYGFSFYSSYNYTNVDVPNSGYTIVNFDSNTFNPYYLSMYGISNGFYIARDGGEASYYNYSSTSLSFEDKSVCKLFLAGEPTTSTINVTYPTSGVEEVKIDRDYFTEVESGAESFPAVGETLVRVYVTPEEETKVTVLFNDAEVELNEESGAYEFTAKESGNLVISAEKSGVNAITSAKVNGNVYSIDGVMIYRNASQEQINTLPAGLYIINNKKVVVRK
jgi:hypothetical protein